jgi:signal transduction histidine kinase
MFNSLKFKITITAFLIISVIMSLSTWRDIKNTEQKLLDGQKEKAVLLSERIAHGIMVLMLKNRWKDLQVFMESVIKDSKELKEIRIFLPDNGTIVTSSEPGEIGKKIYEEDMERFREQGHKEAFLVEKGEQHYASKLTVIKNQPVCHKCHGTEKEILGVLDIEISLAEIDNTIKKFKKEHLTDALMGFVLIGGGFLLVIGLLIDKPIRRMIRTIRKIEKGDLSARMEEDNKDEFGLVAKSFNSMLESLESAKQEIEMYHGEQMKRAAQLASLGEIISGIAHEIKNPLTGISCAVQVFQSEMSEDDSKREVTTEILNHIKRLDRTVKDLLNYAKPKPPNFSPLNVNVILNKAVFFVYPEAKKHNVVIDTGAEGAVPHVMMDPDQMQQVFLNLMINAVQAMPGGGKLKITSSISDREKEEDDFSASEMLPEDAVLIRFEDTGKGIESEYLDSIFDPFFTKKSKGTGLGLAISRRIVQEHGGDIIVKSEIGKGSIFIIYLPIITT